MSEVIRRWLKRRAKPPWISFDSTDIRGFQTLTDAVSARGKAVPLCWATCDKGLWTGYRSRSDKGLWTGYRSRNAFEGSLPLVLRNMIPSHVPIDWAGCC
jgi:hypothetical protein